MNLKYRNSPVTLAAGGYLLIILLLSFLGGTLQGAEDASLGQKVEQATEGAKESLQKAGESAGKTMDELWQRIDEKRLKNRSRDELVGWVMMGLLAAGAGGLLSILRESSFQRFLNVMLGLVGALVGGIIANLTRLDLGMGPVLIRYEELLFSLVGGLLSILLVRFVIARRQKRSRRC